MARYSALQCHSKYYSLRNMFPTMTVNYPTYAVHVWRWLVPDHRDAAFECHSCCAPGSVHPPPSARTVWIMRRSGGEGCVKWSWERQWTNTLSPQASGPGTIEGTHTHTHTHIQSCAHMQIPTNGWFWSKHLAPLIPTMPWATWPTSLPWWPLWSWWLDIGGPHLQTFSQCHH